MIQFFDYIINGWILNRFCLNILLPGITVLPRHMEKNITGREKVHTSGQLFTE